MSSEPVEDDGVLTPEEVRLEPDDDRVVELDENRFVVRPERSASAGASGFAMATDAVGDAPATDIESAAIGAGEPAAALADAPEPHGIDVTLKTDGELTHRRSTSNDVREVFRDLLVWYADQLDDDLSPTEVLQVMLATTDLEA